MLHMLLFPSILVYLDSGTEGKRFGNIVILLAAADINVNKKKREFRIRANILLKLCNMKFKLERRDSKKKPDGLGRSGRVCRLETLKRLKNICNLRSPRSNLGGKELVGT